MKGNTVMSMVNPSTDTLMTKVESRYGLVVLAARRARDLTNGKPSKAEHLSTKPVTNALEEIAEGKITYAIMRGEHGDENLEEKEKESEALASEPEEKESPETPKTDKTAKITAADALGGTFGIGMADKFMGAVEEENTEENEEVEGTNDGNDEELETERAEGK